jgi:hypothetical protein
VLGGGKTGSGDHIAEDGPAEIVPGSKREAGPSNPVLQNAVQRFRGEILVQPSLISAVGITSAFGRKWQADRKGFWL